MKRNWSWVAVTTVLVLLVGAVAAIASSVDVAVVDVTAPTGSVELAPGQSGTITINMTVTGNQAGTATFEVYREWTLNGGTFVGSDPEEFSVPPRGAGDTATTFTTTGTITVAAGQAAGTHSLAVGAFDITNTNSTGAKLAAGSSTSYSVTVSAPTDNLAPVTTCNRSGTTGTNGWYTSDVEVTLNAIDEGGSGEKATFYRIDGDFVAYTDPFTISTEGKTTIYYYSEDNAGNEEEPKLCVVKIDKTAPVIEAGTWLGTLGDNGWYTKDVTVPFTATDDVSGFDADGATTKSLDPKTTSGEGDSLFVTSDTATDWAGNTATAITVSGIKVDKTAPTIGFSPDSDVLLLNQSGAKAYWTASDASPGSGLATAASGSVDLDVSSVTTGTPREASSPKAKDNAGNESEAAKFSYRVVYFTADSVGFLPPIGRDNLFKLGSTIPLKFQLIDGAGAFVTNAVANLSVSHMDGSADGVELEVLPSVSPMNGTAFHYDENGKQYIFNLGTKKGIAFPGVTKQWQTGTWKVTATLNDGSKITTDINLKP